VSFALQRLAGVIQNMEVDEKRMEKNLNETGGLIYSQQVLLYLINEKGMEREKAYKIVQECAHKDGAFQMNLLYDSILSMEEIGKIFNIKYYTKNIDYIFKNTLS
jgi:adenylosuccinate lyase